MLYLICFFAVLLMLLYVLTYERNIDIYIVILTIIVALGNGGYYALAQSTNLEEAILANKLSYVIGIFAPLTVLMLICNVCQVAVPRVLCIILYSIQILIFMAACTIGRSDIFYKECRFQIGEAGGYLTKTYGPAHSVYIIFLLLYTLAGLVIGLYSLGRGAVVSRRNVETLIFVDLLSVGVYAMERLVHLTVELMPVTGTLTIGLMLIPLIKISVYSVYNNRVFFQDRIRTTAYIIFDKKVRFMGCNEYAKTLYPELKEWELEKRIPGSGGRFNTFLRQPLNDYLREEGSDIRGKGTYEYKGEVFAYEICPMLGNSSRKRGCFIQVSNVTDVIRANA